MGLTTFPEIARELIARGRSPETPAMAVRWATRPDQETLAGTLATLPGMIAAHGMKPPATIVVGEVVRLRDKLNWYERLPLFGRRIVVTRAREQADALSDRLRALGADALELPTIEIRPAADYGPLDRAIAGLAGYDWLIFTTANGVRFFVERLDRSGADLRALGAKICAIGPATRAAVEALHLKVDLMGTEYVAEGLLEAFAPFDLAGQRVLLPRAAVARDLVPVELARRGAQVDVVEAYRTGVPEGAAARVARSVSTEAGLHHLHQLLDGPQLRGGGRGGDPAGGAGGDDRSGDYRNRAGAGHRSDRSGAGVHDRRFAGSGPQGVRALGSLPR